MDFKEAISNLCFYKRAVAEEGDYFGEDGLLICGKCHTPKERVIVLHDGEHIVYDWCKCKTEEMEKAKLAEEDARKKARAERLRAEAFRDNRLKDWRFENDATEQSKILDVCKKFVENFDEMKEAGKGLMLYGDVGTGKSYYAACIVNALVEKEIPCLFTNISRITNQLSESFEGRQEYLDSLQRYKLLVLDDIASERNTEYMNEMVYTVIDARYKSKLPLIVTTNLSGEEIKNPDSMQKKRIISRLYEMCFPVFVDGADRRKEKMKEENEKYKKLLGL